MLTTDEVLVALATATATATADALRELAGDEVELGAVSAVPSGRDPLAGAEFPAAVAAATFAGGGARLLVMPMAVALRLAGAEGDELGDTDAASLGEKLRQAFEAAGAAAGAALDTEFSLVDVDVRQARSARDARADDHGPTRATLADVSIFGRACKVVGLIPIELVTRIAQDGPAAGHDDAVRDALGATLRGVPLRVWAEVGRARLRSAEVASLGDGAIVELDRAADDPVDLYVNGSRIATGRLVCIDGKEWAVHLEEVFPSAEADATAA